MIARLSSGIDRLDQILAGGLAENSINLIIGVPGSGKTILAQRYAFQKGTVERPASTSRPSRSRSTRSSASD